MPSMSSRFSSRFVCEEEEQVKTVKTHTRTSVSYPEALKVAGLQQVSQVQDLSDGALLLLRHCSQGNGTQTTYTQILSVFQLPRLRVRDFFKVLWDLSTSHPKAAGIEGRIEPEQIYILPECERKRRQPKSLL